MVDQDGTYIELDSITSRGSGSPLLISVWCHWHYWNSQILCKIGRFPEPKIVIWYESIYFQQFPYSLLGILLLVSAILLQIHSWHFEYHKLKRLENIAHHIIDHQQVNLTRFFLAFLTLGWELFMKIMKSNLKFHLKNHETSPPTKLLSERMPTLKYPNAVSQLSADS